MHKEFDRNSVTKFSFGQVGGPQQILELFLNKSFHHVIYPIHAWCSMVCHKKSLNLLIVKKPCPSSKRFRNYTHINAAGKMSGFESGSFPSSPDYER